MGPDDAARPTNDEVVAVKKGDGLTKALALVGTVLAWLPILATIVFSIIGTIAQGAFRFDYLMPAELFPLALIGGGLLLWAALRARSRQGLVGWGLGVAAALLVAGQILAVVTGLASGNAEPGGWTWAVVIGSLVVYTLAVIEMGVAGTLLLGDLFRQRSGR